VPTLGSAVVMLIGCFDPERWTPQTSCPCLWSTLRDASLSISTFWKYVAGPALHYLMRCSARGSDADQELMFWRTDFGTLREHLCSPGSFSFSGIDVFDISILLCQPRVSPWPVRSSAVPLRLPGASTFLIPELLGVIFSCRFPCGPSHYVRVLRHMEPSMSLGPLSPDLMSTRPVHSHGKFLIGGVS
jgi:hypothetical protein